MHDHSNFHCSDFSIHIALFVLEKETAIYNTDSNIDTDIYQSNVAFGGQGGKKFCFHDANAFLTKLIVHRTDHHIQGLQIYLSNNQSKKFGNFFDPNPATLAGFQRSTIYTYCWVLFTQWIWTKIHCERIGIKHHCRFKASLC